MQRAGDVRRSHQVLGDLREAGELWIVAQILSKVDTSVGAERGNRLSSRGVDGIGREKLLRQPRIFAAEPTREGRLLDERRAGA